MSGDVAVGASYSNITSACLTWGIFLILPHAMTHLAPNRAHELIGSSQSSGAFPGIFNESGIEGYPARSCEKCLRELFRSFGILLLNTTLFSSAALACPLVTSKPCARSRITSFSKAVVFARFQLSRRSSFFSAWILSTKHEESSKNPPSKLDHVFPSPYVRLTQRS